jgi:hypothetical protein
LKKTKIDGNAVLIFQKGEIKMARTIRMGVVLLACGLLAMWIAFIYKGNRSEILIGDRMSEFVDTVDRHQAQYENRLIVFDLDDTIFMSSLLVGTPTWFYTMINLMRQKGAAKNEAYRIATRIDKVVQDSVSVVAVEQATLSAIKTWQSLGAVVVGLTSRPVDLASATHTQLKQVGLEFSSSHFSCVMEKWDNKGGAFVDGVLYLTDLRTKGEVFSHFSETIAECGLEIDLLAAADDQQRYVMEISQIAEKRRADFIGIIYGGAVSSRRFDVNLAKSQLINLESSLGVALIPDEYRTIFANDI